MKKLIMAVSMVVLMAACGEQPIKGDTYKMDGQVYIYTGDERGSTIVRMTYELTEEESIEKARRQLGL